MNPGVALVQAYLQLNGYFTSAEFPVIAGREGGRFEETTDLDMLAVRMPGAVHVVSRGRPGPADDMRLGTDPDLAPARDAIDVVVAEIKEGKARINDAARSPETLYTALSRVGCVPPHLMDDVVNRLSRSGEARVGPDEGAPASCRIRLIAFGDGASGHRDGYTVVSLSHVARFVQDHLERYHHVLHPAKISDPVLGLLHLLRKLE